MPTLLALLVFASQVHGQKVSLEEVVRRSALVVVVVPAAVATREEKVPLAEGQRDAGALPTYTRVRHRYLVKEVLFDDGKGAGVKVSDTLEVDDPNWGLWRAMSFTSMTGGPMPSPVIEELQSACFPEQAGPQVLFLTRRGADLALTISGAWERIENRKRVEAAVKKP